MNKDLTVPLRPVSTYSIVALDRERGEMGVAVQSHWFSVGSVVTWAEAGVGAVATQSFVEASYGPLGLALMKSGKSPRLTLKSLLARDKNREARQVAMINTKGETAVHTGSRCIPEAGHSVGDGFSAQANLMSSDRVWGAMASRFKAARGTLARRLMAALEGAEEEGGDVRGKQSAAMLIVKRKGTSAPWEGKILELRVEDHPEPLKELERLIKIHEAYAEANLADDLASRGRMTQAMRRYSLAAKLAPEIEELKFWQAVGMLNHGDIEEAKPLLSEVFRARKEWRRVLFQLPNSGLLKTPKGIIESLLSP